MDGCGSLRRFDTTQDWLEYESTVYMEERDVYLERYWIDLAESGE